MNCASGKKNGTSEPEIGLEGAFRMSESRILLSVNCITEQVIVYALLLVTFSSKPCNLQFSSEESHQPNPLRLSPSNEKISSFRENENKRRESE